MAKRAKEEREAAERAEQEEKERLEREAAAAEAAAEAAKYQRAEAVMASYEYDDLVDTVVDDDEDEEEDASPLDVLFQFIPYYGQGDPTNDATVRAYLSSLSLGEIDTKDEYGNTLLLLACQYGCDDLVRIMLNKGGDPNAVNSSGASGLHFACYRESMNKAIAKMLLHNGANPDLTEFVNGCTPLHYCASTGDVQFCEMLVNYGAEVSKVDFYQYTCVDYAREGGFTDGVAYLEDVLMRDSRGFGSPGASMSPARGGGFGSPMVGGGGTHQQAFFQSPDQGVGVGGGHVPGSSFESPTSSATAVVQIGLSDPAVKAALVEVEDKHAAAIRAQRDQFRRNVTERDDKLAQLKTDQDMMTREIASFKEEITDKKNMIERTEAVGTANIETLQAELQSLKADSKGLETERDAMSGKLSGLRTELAELEGRLNAVSAEDSEKMAAERAAAEERLVILQEAEKIYKVLTLT